ncbi:unnamed protein product [Trypanosoma congolense IL3000]|uniref:WGS project CAEQ00000000 data, annotated contig 1116 n=1 Tax=Trypanosoma congolense (strain IL3000) TaxID=1068625 RepID=F9W3V5_TRYCI|nr:unnamed protein product [Trypanosoma congolense IL3000]
MHFSSRLEAICATAFPVTSAERIATVVNGFGVKRVRVWENDMEIQTPISASECDLLEGSRSFTSSINSSCDAADFSDTDSISNSEMSNVGWSTGTQSHAINESFSSPASHVRPLPAGSLSCSEEVVVGSGFGNSSPEVLFNNMTMSSSSNVDSPFTSVSSQCTCPTSGSSGTQMSSPKGETTTEKQTDWSSTPDNSNDKCRIAGEDGATTEGSGQLLQSLIVTTQQDLYVDFDAEYDDNDDINYDF